jgi:hypothetical protein
MSLTINSAHLSVTQLLARADHLIQQKNRPATLSNVSFAVFRMQEKARKIGHFLG